MRPFWRATRSRSRARAARAPPRPLPATLSLRAAAGLAARLAGRPARRRPAAADPGGGRAGRPGAAAAALAALPVAAGLVCGWPAALGCARGVALVLAAPPLALSRGALHVAFPLFRLPPHGRSCGHPVRRRRPGPVSDRYAPGGRPGQLRHRWHPRAGGHCHHPRPGPPAGLLVRPGAQRRGAGADRHRFPQQRTDAGGGPHGGADRGRAAGVATGSLPYADGAGDGAPLGGGRRPDGVRQPQPPPRQRHQGVRCLGRQARSAGSAGDRGGPAGRGRSRSTHGRGHRPRPLRPVGRLCRQPGRQRRWRAARRLPGGARSLLGLRHRLRGAGVQGPGRRAAGAPWPTGRPPHQSGLRQHPPGAPAPHGARERRRHGLRLRRRRRPHARRGRPRPGGRWRPDPLPLGFRPAGGRRPAGQSHRGHGDVQPGLRARLDRGRRRAGAHRRGRPARACRHGGAGGRPGG